MVGRVVVVVTLVAVVGVAGLVGVVFTVVVLRIVEDMLAGALEVLLPTLCVVVAEDGSVPTSKGLRPQPGWLHAWQAVLSMEQTPSAPDAVRHAVPLGAWSQDVAFDVYAAKLVQCHQKDGQ